MSSEEARHGRGPRYTRWVDVNKGDEDAPNHRSRYVAKEVKKELLELRQRAGVPLPVQPGAAQASPLPAIGGLGGPQEALRECLRMLWSQHIALHGLGQDSCTVEGLF